MLNWDQLVELDFQALNLITISLRIVMAMIVGGLVGFERGMHNRAAGLRTHVLVCVTACTVMMTNVYASEFYGESDVTRMGAQVISGIGFLGAGTILVTQRNQIKGLTTAASLWAAACLGLTVGIGFYEASVIVTVVLLIILVLLNPLKRKIQGMSLQMEYFIKFNHEDGLSNFFAFCADNDITIIDLHSQTHPNQSQESKGKGYYITVKLDDYSPDECLAAIIQLDHVAIVEKMLG